MGTGEQAFITGSDRTASRHAERSTRLERTTLEPVSAVVEAVVYEGRTIGFIERAGAVFVTLAGEHYATAVEVSQSLDPVSAVEALIYP